LEQTETPKPKLGLLSPKGLALLIVLTALEVAGVYVTAPIPIIPGNVVLAPTTFLEPMGSILFGPIIGAIASMAHWFIFRAMAGYMSIAEFGNVIWGLFVGGLPALLVRNPKDWKQVTLWSCLVQVPAAFLIGAWFELLGVVPMMVLAPGILLADIPGTLIGTPIAVTYLYPRLKRMGLIWPHWYKLKD
jgi:energy-coupling factor transport system substrate-specific component